MNRCKTSRYFHNALQHLDQITFPISFTHEIISTIATMNYGKAHMHPTVYD